MPIHSVRHANGFTLLDKLIAIVVLSVLCALVLPSYSAAVARAECNTLLTALVGSVTNARGAAMNYESDAILCPSDDGASCSGSTLWHNGWIVGVDRDGDNSIGGGEMVLARQDAFEENVNMVTTSRRTRLQFPPYGSNAGSGTIVVDRATFQRAGGFSERPMNAEDHDLMLRLGEARGFVALFAPVTVAWRRHGGNITTNLARTVEGVNYLIQQERRDQYPGGHRRAPARRRIITRHARPVTFHCLRDGHVRPALRLFRATMAWNVSDGHFAYLGAFPLLTVSSAARRMLR